MNTVNKILCKAIVAAIYMFYMVSAHTCDYNTCVHNCWGQGTGCANDCYLKCMNH